MGNILNCTVFNAATSQPSDCITKPAIVLPTYLATLSLQSQKFAQSFHLPVDNLGHINVSSSQALAVILVSLHDWRQQERVSLGRGSLLTLSRAVRLRSDTKVGFV
jgi:hypothetical protein